MSKAKTKAKPAAKRGGGKHIAVIAHHAQGQALIKPGDAITVDAFADEDAFAAAIARGDVVPADQPAAADAGESSDE